jgi:flagellar hook-associated protein 3 FlgL
MRVATSTFGINFLTQLNQLEQRQNNLQTQAATGQLFSLPEDNPSAMGQVLNLQTDVNATTQYQNNITQLQQTATSTSDAITGLKAISDRMNEIATLADGTKSPAQLQAYATEVGQLIQQAVQLGNSKDQGNYIFGGTATGAPPFVATTDASGNVTGVTYQGNTSVAQVEISPGTTVSTAIPGVNTTGTGPRGLFADSRYGADFFGHLISLRNDLQSGNTAAIASTDAPQLSKDEDNLLYHVTANGIIQSRLQAAGTLATQHNLSSNTELSQKTSADIAQTITELQQAQTAYSAALQSGSSILNLSLLNYLH